MRNLAPYISFQNLSEGMDGREEVAAFGEVGSMGRDSVGPTGRRAVEYVRTL